MGKCEGVYRGHEVAFFTSTEYRSEAEYGIRSERHLRWQSRVFELDCGGQRESDFLSGR